MYEVDKQLFIGIKISPKLQRELDNCAPGTEHYFNEVTGPRMGKACSLLVGELTVARGAA